MQKRSHKPRKKSLNKGSNQMLESYQKLRANEGGTVTFHYVVEKEQDGKLHKVVTSKRVLTVSKEFVEKRSISEILTVLTSIQRDFGATYFTF